MSLAPTDYDFGNEENFAFAKTITCGNEEARKMFVRAFGHMLNYNHEEAIACFSKCAELDPNCAMAYWGIAYCVSSNYNWSCLLYTSPSPRDLSTSRMPSSA